MDISIPKLNMSECRHFDIICYYYPEDDEKALQHLMLLLNCLRYLCCLYLLFGGTKYDAFRIEHLLIHLAFEYKLFLNLRIFIGKAQIEKES